jgi:tRNA A-37 threonylcarbamoyl transferase component Bud32
MSDAQAEKLPGSANGSNPDSTPTVSSNVDTIARRVIFLEIPDDALPVSFGRFQLRGVLGQGAFGKVYRAYDKQLDREVAVKIPRCGPLEMPDQLSRFLREARLGGKLHHPNICPIHDVGEFQGSHYIVMGLIEGTPLSHLVSSEKPMDPRTAAKIVLELTAALAEAHDYGIVHRDLKPSNIMMDEKRREPVILDFGLARSFVREAYESQSGLLLGTPRYMSPEQLRGVTVEVGPQSDVYSLGVILYELIAGRPPFCGSVAEIFSQILTFEPRPPSSYQPQLDRAICSICLKAMCRDAAQRYESMRDFGAALRGYLQDVPAVPSSGIGLPAAAAHLVDRGPAPPAPPAATAPPPEKIEFACPKCGLRVQTLRSTAGKKGRCPNCGAIVPIVAIADVVDSPSSSHGVPSAHRPPQLSAPPQRIEFSCPHCQKTVRPPAGIAGKKGRCPWCGRVVKIPGDNAS